MLRYQSIYSNENNQSQIEPNTLEMERLEAKLKLKRTMRNSSNLSRRGSLRNKSPTDIINSQNLKKEDFDNLQILINLFSNVRANINQIEEYFEKHNLSFLMELKEKIIKSDYQSLIEGMELYRLPQGQHLQQEGKYHGHHYFLLCGNLGAFHQKKITEDQKQYIHQFSYPAGSPIISNQILKHNPYTVRATQFCLLIRFSQEVYNKYYKRYFQKQIEDLAYMMGQSIVFRGISKTDIRRFIGCCRFKYFHYHENIYAKGDTIEDAFMIIDGEVELSNCQIMKKKEKKRNKQNYFQSSLFRKTFQNHQKQVKLIQLNKKEIFGIEFPVLRKDLSYIHTATSKSEIVKVLVFSIKIFEQFELQYPHLEDNIGIFYQRVENINQKLKENCINIKYTKNPKIVDMIVKKKKGKKDKKLKNSLQWWGLAQKVQNAKKYRMPTPPKKPTQKQIRKLSTPHLAQTQSKFHFFKKKLFDKQLEEMQQDNDFQREQMESPYQLRYEPKIQKLKIRMINIKPRVVNQSQKVKKKLYEYAKNQQVFCNQLLLN